MNKGLIVVLLFISTWASATNYYVAPNGKDTDSGTISQPWGSWKKAFATAQAGDTVFFRGGVYYNITYNEARAAYSGTSSKRIVYINYPGETPILDCGRYRPTGEYNDAIYIDNKSYIDIIGLTVRNLLQTPGVSANSHKGIGIYDGNEVRVINCVVHNMSGYAFEAVFNQITGPPYNKCYFINCDAYNIIDTLSPPGFVGGTGTGFSGGSFRSGYSADGIAYYYGCRAWNCSDQGFSVALDGPIVVDNCWSFSNGQQLGSGDSGEGIGFKLGWAAIETSATMRRVTRCISAYNEFCGYETNDYGYVAVPMELYNNLSYRDGRVAYGGGGYGFWVMTTRSSQIQEERRVLRNNIAIEAGLHNMYLQGGAYYTHSHNSWDGGATVSSNDFNALPSTREACISLLTSPRKPDGSLPDIGDYFSLKESSKAKDAGIEVGIPYNGIAPDLGPFEVSTGTSPSNIPNFLSAVIENATPARLEMTYSISLANLVPAPSAFNVRVNNTSRTVSSVSVSGTNVYLSLASPVTYGDIVTVAYTKPASNPIQTASGAQAVTLTAQNVTNNCIQVLNQAPIVSISSPTKGNNFIAPATITIDAVASDPDGSIIKVEFFNGQTKIGETNIAPYYFTWKEVKEGTYILTAVATDNLNSKTTSAPVTITVDKSVGNPNKTPTIEIKHPKPGKIWKYNKKEPILIEAEASDLDGEIIKVEFKSGNTTIAEVFSPPYSFVLENADLTRYVITAIATDNLGATSESTEIEFIVYDSELPNPDIIKIFPNPNDGHFTLEISYIEIESTPYEVKIVNASGRTIVHTSIIDQLPINEFNLTDVPSGVYVLMLLKDNKLISTGKLVIR